MSVATFLLLLYLAFTPCDAWSGIFINSRHGTQLYNPFHSPHTTNVTGQFGIPVQNEYSAWAKLGSDVFLFGGNGKEVYVVNTVTNTTKIGPPLPYTLNFAFATAINSKTILLCGGFDFADRYVLKLCHTFDGRSYTQVADYPLPLLCATIVVLDGKPYVFGGARESNIAVDNVYYYEGSKWVARKTMPLTAACYGAVAVDSHTAMVCGSTYSNMVGDCYMYSAVSDAWTKTFSVGVQKKNSDLYLVNDFSGRIYAIHGTTVEVYDAKTGWSPTAGKLLFDATGSAVVGVQ